MIRKVKPILLIIVNAKNLGKMLSRKLQKIINLINV